MININNNTGIVPATIYPSWKKITKTYSDFSTAGLTNNISIYTLQPKEVILAYSIKHTTQFSGTLITSILASIGIVGTLALFLQGTTNMTGAPNGVDINIGNSVFMQSTSGTTDVRLTLVSIGAFLNALTAGVVEVQLLTSIQS